VPRPSFELPGWFDGRYYTHLDSTNDEAKRLAEAGARDGTFVVAVEQGKGRGRSGRQWSSPPGNLYSSLLLRDIPSPTEGALYSFVAALAVADAIIAADEKLAVSLKWPNDVLVNGLKISGILLESSAARNWLVIGAGINVACKPNIPGLAATSLSDQSLSITLDDFASLYAASLANWVTTFRTRGFHVIREAWLARARGVGEPIKARVGNAEYHGIFQDLDETGALILVDGNGNNRSITSGEVFFDDQL